MSNSMDRKLRRMKEVPESKELKKQAMAMGPNPGGQGGNMNIPAMKLPNTLYVNVKEGYMKIGEKDRTISELDIALTSEEIGDNAKLKAFLESRVTDDLIHKVILDNSTDFKHMTVAEFKENTFKEIKRQEEAKLNNGKVTVPTTVDGGNIVTSTATKEQIDEHLETEATDAS